MQKICESITTILVLRPHDLSWIEHVCTSRSDLVKSLISRMKTTLGTKQFVLEPWTLFSMEKPCHNVFFYDAVYLHCIISIFSHRRRNYINTYIRILSVIHIFISYIYIIHDINICCYFYIERYVRSIKNIKNYFIFLFSIYHFS